MPQGFPDPYSAASSGFRQSFFPMLEMGMKADREKRLEAQMEEDRKAKFMDMGIKVLGLKNPQQRQLGLKLMAGASFGGDKEKMNQVISTIGTFSDEQRQAMVEDMNLWRQSITGGKKPSAELESRIGLYEKMFMRGDMDMNDLVKISGDLQKRADDLEAQRVMGGGMPGAETKPAASTPATSAPAATPIAPIIEAQGSQEGGIGSTALAQRLLEAQKPQVSPAGAVVPPVGVTPSAPAAPTPGTLPPGGSANLYDIPADALRRREAQLRQMGTAASIKMADNLAKIAEAKTKEEEKGEKAPVTRTVDIGNERLTQQWDKKNKQWTVVAKAPRFQERPSLETLEKESAARARGSQKPLSRVYEESYERTRGSQEAKKEFTPVQRASAIRSTIAQSVNQTLATRRGPLGEFKMEGLNEVDKAKFNLQIKSTIRESLKAQGIDIKEGDLPKDPLNFFYGPPKLKKPDALVHQSGNTKITAQDIAEKASAAVNVKGLNDILQLVQEARKNKKIPEDDANALEGRIILRLNELGQ